MISVHLHIYLFQISEFDKKNRHYCIDVRAKVNRLLQALWAQWASEKKVYIPIIELPYGRHVGSQSQYAGKIRLICIGPYYLILRLKSSHIYGLNVRECECVASVPCFKTSDFTRVIPMSRA